MSELTPITTDTPVVFERDGSEPDRMIIGEVSTLAPADSKTGFETGCKDRGSRVYVVQSNDGHVKVGRSGNVAHRLAVLQRSGGFLVSKWACTPALMNAPAIEASAKREFPQRVGEWLLADFDAVVRHIETTDWIFDAAQNAEAERIRAAAAKERYPHLDPANWGLAAIFPKTEPAA